MANYVSFAVINSPSLVCQNMLTAMMQYLIGQYEGGVLLLLQSSQLFFHPPPSFTSALTATDSCIIATLTVVFLIGPSSASFSLRFGRLKQK